MVDCGQRGELLLCQGIAKVYLVDFTPLGVKGDIHSGKGLIIGELIDAEA